ncbi:hypothetical protein CCR75_009422 [Bremia lactucae]|uniref:Uncharacterized protein n=1 Tax=Bremia lactucae TaxID=4779 RepID=A0A976ILG1_BRELC|nr:hypothetical protein CCR75_009422 [Bremia lactucae]
MSKRSAEDQLQWIFASLQNSGADFLEFELDNDSQHLFDNMDILLADFSPNDHRRPPLQLTPSVLSAISGLQASTVLVPSKVTPVPPASFRTLRKNGQTATAYELRHAATTPRKLQPQLLGPQKTIATAAATITYETSMTRLASRKKLTRRLFE